ncbi:MAG TPA: DUF1343 domain-containing protein, partial [Armatimonadetes bacterium]|nr:DUF1343 domain-containing protein [Armatimonadota bacterium]
GLYCVVTDREAFQPVRMVIHLAELLHRFHTREFTFDRIDTLVGTERVRVLLEQFAPAEAIIAEWEEEETGFRERRAPFLLYE